MNHAPRPVRIGLSAVVVAVTAEVPRIVTVACPPHAGLQWQGSRAAALPTGEVDPVGDPTLERALRVSMTERIGLELGYVEQLYTFGDRFRRLDEYFDAPRTVSVAYLALVREAPPSGATEAEWRQWYTFLPWEDWRSGRPAIVVQLIEPALTIWVSEASEPGERASRRERADIAFGLGGSAWDGERVLERYELLYEADLVVEAHRDREAARRAGRPPRIPARAPGRQLGEGMAFDHRRILATAMGRVRGKLRYRPVVFELLPSEFTLLHLQGLVEALAGVRLHKQNFRRLVERGGLVEGTGRLEPRKRGRPAELFRFRREVLRERPEPGVGHARKSSARD